MDNNFEKVMSENTDEELIKIVTVERDDYQPLAVEIAEKEIKKRDIDTSKFYEIIGSQINEKKVKEKNESDIVSSGVRFINFLIDFILWYIIAYIISLIMFVSDNILIGIIGYLFLLSSYIGYYSIMEIKYQKTVGKFITKTKVVKINGDKPENRDILIRTFCRLIPFDRLSFIFSKKGFHDSLSDTIVINDKAD